MKIISKISILCVITILFLMGCSQKPTPFYPVPDTPKNLVSSVKHINYGNPKPVKTIFDMFRESLSEDNSSGSSSSKVKGGSCYSIKNENMKNACLANALKKENHCFAITNGDSRNLCLGVVRKNEANCFGINSDNKDSQNFCLGSVKNDQSYCFQIKNEDLKNSCIAGTQRNKNYCFQIKNEDTKNSCLGGFE